MKQSVVSEKIKMPSLTSVPLREREEAAKCRRSEEYLHLAREREINGEIVNRGGEETRRLATKRTSDASSVAVQQFTVRSLQIKQTRANI